MVQRNARRKRVLQRKLEALHQHLESVAGTAGQSAAATVLPPGEGEEGGAGPETREFENIAEGSPGRRISPTHSTGSSAELVEAPTPEDEAEGAAAAAAAAASTSDTTASGKKSETSGKSSSLDSWKRYASLGSSRK